MRMHSLLALRAPLGAIVLGASALGAQLPSASVAGNAMAGNFTAIARGYEAVRWNPANLSMPGRPFISFGTAILGGNMGLDPVDIKTIRGFGGKDVDSATKVQWVDQAIQAGGQTIRMDGGVTYLGMSVGPVGLHVGSQLYTSMRLSPDAWEAMLFGNAGNNNGQPKTLDLTGTSVRGGAFTTGAMSFALPIPINLTQGIFLNERAAIGITGKYVLGHGVLIADDQGSTFGGQDITLNFPVILPNESARSADSLLSPPGKGFGADVGISWSGGPWKVGVLAENVFNNFAWDTTKFAFLPGTGAYSVDSDTSDFEEQPFAQAPATLREIVSKQAFKPGFAVGVSFQPMSSLTLTADMKKSLGGDEAIVFGSKSHFGVGAEYRLLGFLPLRGGVASVADGWQAGAGFGLRLLGYELGLATSVRRRGQAMESGFMIGLVGIGR